MKPSQDEPEDKLDNIVDFGAAQSSKLLHDLRDHPFLAVVLYEDGGVCVFDKGLGPEEVERIREAIEGKLSERMDADGN